MPADGFYSDKSLDASQHVVVDRISVAFEKAWQRGELPKLEDYLNQLEASSPVRPFLFRDLIGLDIHYRRKRGEQPNAQHYVSRFPQYAGLIFQLFGQPRPSELTEPPTRPIPRPPPPPHGETHSESGEAPPSTSRQTPKRPASQAPRQTGAVVGGSKPPPPDPRPPVPPPRHLGRYQIVGGLGEGTFGRVYLAKDPQLDRLVAIKVSRGGLFSSEDTGRRFLDEARKAAELGDKHPGIVTIHDVMDHQGRPPYCIVMEYVEGGTLDKPKRAKKLTFTGIANLMARVADAVHFAHTRGLIHRDIKPANILLDTSGDPKVADFGLAIHESEQPSREGELSGTWPYMSPEQARRETEHLDGRTDVWSMGATLYELLTGRRPFLGGTWSEVKKQILHRQVKPPRQINDAIPEELERICLKALNKEQKDRYSTARDFAKDLRRAARADQPTLWQRYRLLGWALACALAVVLVIVVVLSSFGPSNGDGGEKVPPGLAPGREFKKLAAVLDESSRQIISVELDDYAISGDEEGTVWVHRYENEEKLVPLGWFRLPAGAWDVCFSRVDKSLVALSSELPYVYRISIDRLARPEDPPPSPQPALVNGFNTDPPEGLVAHDGSAWAVRKSRLQGIGPRSGEYYVGPSPLQYPAVASANGRLVLFGHSTADGQWHGQMREDATSELRDVPLIGGGPVYSVAISDNGDVAVGGCGSGVGVQVCKRGRSPQRLDDPDEDARFFYHCVAISPDGQYVYAVSRYIPRSTGKQEYGLLRAWSVGQETPIARTGQEVTRKEIRGPVQAAAFLPSKRRLLVVVNQTLELWELP